MQNDHRCVYSLTRAPPCHAKGQHETTRVIRMGTDAHLRIEEMVRAHAFTSADNRISHRWRARRVCHVGARARGLRCKQPSTRAGAGYGVRGGEGVGARQSVKCQSLTSKLPPMRLPLATITYTRKRHHTMPHAMQQRPDAHLGIGGDACICSATRLIGRLSRARRAAAASQ